jgi:hypothetical protein
MLSFYHVVAVRSRLLPRGDAHDHCQRLIRPETGTPLDRTASPTERRPPFGLVRRPRSGLRLLRAPVGFSRDPTSTTPDGRYTLGRASRCQPMNSCEPTRTPYRPFTGKSWPLSRESSPAAARAKAWLSKPWRPISRTAASPSTWARSFRPVKSWNATAWSRSRTASFSIPPPLGERLIALLAGQPGPAVKLDPLPALPK